MREDHPYRVEGRLLLNVEQIIPLPEAEEYTVGVRRRAVANRTARASNQDRTRYIVTTPNGSSAPLFKRRAVLAMVHAVHRAGVQPDLLLAVLAHRKFRAVKGMLEGDKLQESFQTEYPEIDLRRWFFDEPLYDEKGDQTWVVSNQWGLNTVLALEELAALVPDIGISFEPG